MENQNWNWICIICEQFSRTLSTSTLFASPRHISKNLARANLTFHKSGVKVPANWTLVHFSSIRISIVALQFGFLYFGGQDLFFHSSQIRNRMRPHQGDWVECALAKDRHGRLCASSVRILHPRLDRPPRLLRAMDEQSLMGMHRKIIIVSSKKKSGGRFHSFSCRLEERRRPSVVLRLKCGADPFDENLRQASCDWWIISLTWKYRAMANRSIFAFLAGLFCRIWDKIVVLNGYVSAYQKTSFPSKGSFRLYGGKYGIWVWL